ncbi:MAG: hypothetical protein EA398_14185 [Deltaproteobacteria bacterium]|nr:MAG: hypothetical protein EA398_14185 [Deltaproteobacteria bacterium]
MVMPSSPALRTSSLAVSNTPELRALRQPPCPEEETIARCRELRAIEDALDRLPDGAGRLPAPHDVALLLRNRAATMPLVLARLDGPLPATADHSSAVRNGWLVNLAGEWRCADAIPALLHHLGAPHAYADEDVLHALTRIGPHAMGPLLLALFDRGASVQRRVRAARVLSSIAIAARLHGHRPEWPGRGEQQAREIAAAMRLLLARAGVEPHPVLRAAVRALCDMRWVEARREIVEFVERGPLAEDETFNVELLELTLCGTLEDVELGAWDVSLLAWMTKEVLESR